MNAVPAFMVFTLFVLAIGLHPALARAAASTHATIKLTVVADSPYNYEIKEINLSQEKLTDERLLPAHSKAELAVEDNNQHMVIVTEQQTASTADPNSCAATFKADHGQVYSIHTQRASKTSLAKCDIKPVADGSLKIVVSHSHS